MCRVLIALATPVSHFQNSRRLSLARCFFVYTVHGSFVVSDSSYPDINLRVSFLLSAILPFARSSPFSDLLLFFATLSIRVLASRRVCFVFYLLVSEPINQVVLEVTGGNAFTKHGHLLLAGVKVGDAKGHVYHLERPRRPSFIERDAKR